MALIYSFIIQLYNREQSRRITTLLAARRPFLYLTFISSFIYIAHQKMLYDVKGAAGCIYFVSAVHADIHFHNLFMDH